MLLGAYQPLLGVIKTTRMVKNWLHIVILLVGWIACVVRVEPVKPGNSKRPHLPTVRTNPSDVRSEDELSYKNWLNPHGW